MSATSMTQDESAPPGVKPADNTNFCEEQA